MFDSGGGHAMEVHVGCDDSSPQTVRIPDSATHHGRPVHAELVAELGRLARGEGRCPTAWPGLTLYRFAERVQEPWGGVESVSICVFASSGPSLYAAICGRGDLGGEQMALRTADAHVCMVLNVDPQLVCSVAGAMPHLGRDPECETEHGGLPLDDELTATVLRFLRSLVVTADRVVLTPLYVQEIIYRVLQRDRRSRLLRLASAQLKTDPVAPARDYIATHLSDQLSVDILAARVNLSASAFSRAFRQTTGRSPYQYVKETRLNRARVLLDEGRLGVSDAARAVGYASVSHFIKEFRAKFGATPGDYVGVQRFGRAS